MDGGGDLVGGLVAGLVWFLLQPVSAPLLAPVVTLFAEAAPPMLMAPTLREQAPSVSSPSPGIQSRFTRAMPSKSIG